MCGSFLTFVIFVTKREILYHFFFILDDHTGEIYHIIYILIIVKRDIDLFCRLERHISLHFTL